MKIQILITIAIEAHIYLSFERIRATLIEMSRAFSAMNWFLWVILNGCFDRCLSLGLFIGVTNCQTRTEKLSDWSGLQNYVDKTLSENPIKADLMPVQIVYRSGRCSRRDSAITAHELNTNLRSGTIQTLDAMILGDFLVGCQLFGSYLGVTDVPILARGCLSGSMDDQNRYPHFMRMAGSWKKMGIPFYHFIKKMNWKKLTIVSTFRNEFYIGAQQVKLYFETKGITVTLTHVDRPTDDAESENTIALNNAVDTVKLTSGGDTFAYSFRS